MSGPEVNLIAIVVIILGGISIAWIMRRKGSTQPPAVDAAALRDEVAAHLKDIASSFGAEVSRLLKAHIATLEKTIDAKLNPPVLTESVKVAARSRDNPHVPPIPAPPTDGVTVTTQPPSEAPSVTSAPAPEIPATASPPADAIDGALAALDKTIADATAKRAAIVDARAKLAALVSP